MIKSAFKFYKLQELFKNLKKLPSKRKYIAGGSDLVISLRTGTMDVDCLVDISDIKELNLIKENDNSIFVGSCIRISELEKNFIIKKYIPALFECVKYYASPSIRNVATIGGNLANASPCADGVLALVASKAKLVLNLYGEKRTVFISEILKGPKKTSLKKDELIEGFIIPKWNHKAVFLKIMGRKNFGISKVGLCVCADVKGNLIKDINISASSVYWRVVECKKTSEFLRGKEINEKVIHYSQNLILSEISPIKDHRSTDEYRRELISVLVKRALLKLIN